MIVVDTNIIVYFHVEGDHTKEAWQVFQKDSEWYAPFLWQSEFRNTMFRYLRSNLLLQTDVLEFAEAAEKMMIGNELHLLPNDIFPFAASSSCSAYDCEFVALAKELGVPLVTADKQILREFPETAVSPQQFVNG
ncbi:type II toxin-antitoxin system VapC family toxin [Candidatus Leptofilum sp.]|uniref:type II toxin-antitoxin system VapC family toxin n=1 Tax=Candidatus Leptofilum sp. TaxID=3241576 RepID=UPI003B5C76D6